MHRFIPLLCLVAVAAAASAADLNRPDERKIINVDFTKELDVESLNSESYSNFIKELRRDLAVEYSHGVPVLPVHNPDDRRGFDLLLRSGACQTTVRIHRESLELRGFQSQRDQRWFEFRHEDGAHRIEGSEFLEFSSYYRDLSAAAQQDILDVSFNKDALRDAVSKLASSKNSQDIASALIVVAPMIIEATAFLNFFNHFAPSIASGEPVRLPEWMLNDLVYNWPGFSYMVLKSDADPCFQFKPPTVHGRQIQNVGELRKILGIMMRDPDTLSPPCSPGVLYAKMKKILAFQARNII